MSTDKPGNNVIFLAYRNETPTQIEEFLSCGCCKNKTWKAVWYGDSSGFPLLVCAGCGQHAGKFGWVNPEEEKS